MEAELNNFKQALEQADVLNIFNSYNLLIEHIIKLIKNIKMDKTKNLNDLLVTQKTILVKSKSLYDLIKELTYDTFKENDINILIDEVMNDYLLLKSNTKSFD